MGIRGRWKDAVSLLSNGREYGIMKEMPEKGAWGSVAKFLNNLRHGRGVFTLADGTVQAGLFENDVFIG